ncbi:MAG: hypothetical protein C0413_01300 [Clostridiales bacterium]|nr:hypothetical protein [Clostridiales bacterium]
MKPPYESEIRAQIRRILGDMFPNALVSRIHLPSRDAHASIHLPDGIDAASLAAEDFGSLYGAQLVASLRSVNGWLLFDFSPAFFSALVDEINRALPAPERADETLAENRMYVLSRHEDSGCPDHPAFHRALTRALVAHESKTAFARAETAALSLFHSIPARERPALLSRCGALGGAILRLLTNTR